MPRQIKTTEIERRLTALEQAIKDLRSHASPPRSHPIYTLERIHGVFENDRPFQEAVRLGRQWRKSRGAASGKSRAPSK